MMFVVSLYFAHVERIINLKVLKLMLELMKRLSLIVKIQLLSLGG
jgi:hypothetical protein